MAAGRLTRSSRLSERLTGALSFGAMEVYEQVAKSTRRVTVANYTGYTQYFDISTSFRFADDEDNGAVSVDHPGRVKVPAYGTTEFLVTAYVDGAALRDWGIGSGPDGSSGDGLTVFEYDGYLDLTPTDGGDSIHMAWQVLPRKANAVKARRTISTTFDPDLGFAVGTGELHNVGVGTASMEAFSLIGVSPDLPEGAQGAQAPVVDLRYVGVTTIPVPAGFCSADESYLMRFAINTWEPQAHSNVPGIFELDLDTNQDGVFDYAILNWDLGYPGIGDGRNVTWVFDLATGDGSAFFFTEHTFNSKNTVLTICGEQIGQNAANFFQPMTVDALAVDIYFQGAVTDAILGMEISPLGERYLGFPDTLDPYSSGSIEVYDFGKVGTNPSESGLLLLTTSDSGAKKEAITLRIRPPGLKGGGSPH